MLIFLVAARGGEKRKHDEEMPLHYKPIIEDNENNQPDTFLEEYLEESVEQLPQKVEDDIFIDNVSLM